MDYEHDFQWVPENDNFYCIRCNRPSENKSFKCIRGNMKRSSDYAIVEVTDNKIFLEDLNLGNVSVTNDAENVVAGIAFKYPKHRIVYKDSMGNWDELLHNNGTFTGYSHYTEEHP